MMHTLLLCLVATTLVLAAPNNPRIGPENEKDLEQVQAATTCQTAILRCCTPKTPTTDATWRCFEKNNCGGLFVVHEINDNNNNAEPSLGACAYLSKVKSMIEEVGNEESIDKEEEEEVNKETFEEELPKEELPIEEEIDTEISERNVGRPGFLQQEIASQGCSGGSYESCIKDELEGCGALDTVTTHDSYVKCVHHCVDHCNREGEI